MPLKFSTAGLAEQSLLTLKVVVHSQLRRSDTSQQRYTDSRSAWEFGMTRKLTDEW
jgi:hypothetical protein